MTGRSIVTESNSGQQFPQHSFLWQMLLEPLECFWMGGGEKRGFLMSLFYGTKTLCIFPSALERGLHVWEEKGNCSGDFFCPVFEVNAVWTPSLILAT